MMPLIFKVTESKSHDEV